MVLKTLDKLIVALLLLEIMAFVGFAATSNVTTMTWFVPSNRSHTIAYGGSCSQTSFFFPEDSCVWDSDADGNGSKCLPYNATAGGTACQSSSVAAITVTNNGNLTFNVDGNFTTAFTGVDQNLDLKVWMGTGAGCGTAGLGGWQGTSGSQNGWAGCTVTVSTNPVTSSTCRDYDSRNDLNAGRLITSLAVGDTNQLCFSGDFNGNVTQGSHAKDFNTTSI